MYAISTRKPESRVPVVEPLAEIVTRVIDNISQRTGIPDFQTGLNVIDEGIHGFHKSQLTVLAARPGVGKTSLACQVAYQLAKNRKNVAFLSLEMTKESIMERIFCSEYSVNGMDLIRGKMDIITQSKASAFTKECADLPLKVIDDYCHTENELYTLIEHLSFRPDIIFLDHIQHIRSSERKSQYESLTEYLRYLKEIAMRYKIAVVVLSQINRPGEEAPSLANLKGTGALEEMSDHVLMLHQLKEPDKITRGNFKVQVAKNRFGPVGTFDLYFSGSIYKFFNSYHESAVAA